MINQFAIQFLEGLTNFVFDKAVLQRIAYRRGIAEAEFFSDIDENTEWLCTKDLLTTAIRGPWSTANHTNKHGNFEQIVGQQVITAGALEEIKAQIRQLNRDLGLPDDDGIPDAATNEWVNDTDW